MSKDADDASLNEYKVKLLGSPTTSALYDAADPRQVIIIALVIEFKERPENNISISLRSAGKMRDLYNCYKLVVSSAPHSSIYGYYINIRKR